MTADLDELMPARLDCEWVFLARLQRSSRSAKADAFRNWRSTLKALALLPRATIHLATDAGPEHILRDSADSTDEDEN